MTEQASIPDALLPPEMAAKAETIGVRKAAMDVMSTLALGVLAGAFIAMGAVFATTVMVGDMAWGLSRLFGGLAFSVGLIMVVVGGAELFTGNTLIVMAWAGRKVGTISLLRNWGLVFAGNFIGAVGTAVLVFLAGHHTLAAQAVGFNALNIAQAKCDAGFVELLVRGVLGNAMVCIAVWLSFSARSTIDRVLVVIPPIAVFVAAGFEHCVANMYYIPAGLLIKNYGGLAAMDYPALTPAGFGHNLLAVTIGNIIGGGLLVGAMYWFIYLRRRGSKPIA